MGKTYADTLAGYDALASTQEAQKILMQEDKPFAKINGYMSDGAPVFEAAKQPPKPQSKKAALKRFDSIEYEEVKFLVSPYIPMGKITIVQGDSGTGKTAFACKLAAEVSTGGGILDHKCLMGNVLLLSVEDDSATLRGKIEAGGSDVSRCFL
jgi:RecA-family ATPase